MLKRNYFLKKMKYFHKLMWMFGLGIVLSCEEDGFPMALYDYQVERLLHGGTEKMWQTDEEGVMGYLLFESLDTCIYTVFVSPASSTTQSFLVLPRDDGRPSLRFFCFYRLRFGAKGVSR